MDGFPGSLRFLRMQKNKYSYTIDSGWPEDHFKSLKHGLRFIEDIYFVTMNEYLERRIQFVVGTVFKELRSLSNSPANESLNSDLACTYRNCRETLKKAIFNPDTSDYDVIFLKPSRKVNYFLKFNKKVIKYIGILFKYNDDLITPLLKEKLWFLKALLTYVANIGDHYVVGSEDLYATLHALLDKPACLIYSCLVDKMDEEIKIAMMHNLSALLEKNKVKNIYIKVLRTSRFQDKKGNFLGSESFLLQSLIEILECTTSFVCHRKDLSMKLHDNLKILHTFLGSLPHERIVEMSSHLVTSTEYIISGAILIIYSCYDNNGMTKEKAKELYGSVLNLVDQIKHMQIDFLRVLDLNSEYLEGLLNRRPEMIEIMAKEIQTLYLAFDDLSLLRAFLMDPPKAFVEDGNLKLLNLLASDVISIISVFNDDTVLDKIRHIYLHRRLYDLLEQGKSYTVKSKFQRIYPVTGQLEFVDHLVENLKELVIVKADSIAPFKFYILKLIEGLQFVSSHLMVLSQEHKEQPHLKNLQEDITNSAYEVEWIIDDFMVRELPVWYYMSLLIKELNVIRNCEVQLRTELGDIQEIASLAVDVHSHGFFLQIFLLSDVKHDKLLEIFNHRLRFKQFNVRTWCLCSSYRQRKKEVILQLLQNASYQPDVAYDDNIAYKSDLSQYKLETSLSELVMNKKSLIILEDVQDITTVHDILRDLPNPGYDGVIILETRSPELAVQCGNPLQKFVWNKYSQERTSNSETNVRSTDSNEVDVVGFKEEMKTMLELLIGGPMKLHLISIVGMVGLGKTTLVKKLYNNRSVVDHFDIRSWCYVSQVYETKKLMLELLSRIGQLSDTMCHMDDGQLANLLHRELRGRRFLIVLDDMWSTGAWNNLSICFPYEKNGSRIIFTTRIHELSSEVQSRSIELTLGYLSEKESWELLRNKLSEYQRFPDELTQVGTQIAKGCKGLPISIVLVARVLAKTNQTKHQWTKILDSLTACIHGEANEHGQGIIEMSYMHLPDYLKPCFLYFGQFLRDSDIPVSKMIRMWIAEGLIRHTNLKSLENVAEDCLMNLIGRSLVTISREKSIGGVKSCRVHDLIYEFCVTKAKEEFFLQQIRGYNEHFPSTDSYKDYGMDPNYIYSSEPITYNQPRLCIYSKRNHFIMLKPSGPEVRSLSFLPASDTHPSYPYDISFISHNFKLLIILNLEDISIDKAFNALMVLVHLRYLAVQSYMDCIPSSIANLWKLETFLFKGLRAKVIEVPDSICDMVKLRHVHINESASFKLDPDRSKESSILNNLQTLSTPIVTHGGDMEKMLKRVKGIKKLKCIFLDSWDDTTNCNMFPKLGFLSQLVSLNVSYNGIGKSLCEFDFPSNLTKLTLLNFRKPWSEISQLARLNNLEVLKLLSNAFEGKTWNMEDEAFLKLKFLKLDSLDLEQWIADDDSFPLLEHLILNKCEQLEEIPSCLQDIIFLEKIEVIWCKQSVAFSAKEIHNRQMEYGNDVKIHVHPDVDS